MTSPASPPLAQLAQRIDARDRPGAIAVALATVHDASSLVDLYRMLSDLQADVGRSWQAGTTEVWEEHWATATVRTIVEACAPLVTAHAAPDVGRGVLLATPPEEYHDVGLRMTADLFTLAGWSAHLLGASVPLAQLVAAIEALGVDAVALSASTHFNRLALRTYVNRLVAACPQVRVLVGGPAFAFRRGDWHDGELLEPGDIARLADRMGA